MIFFILSFFLACSLCAQDLYFVATNGDSSGDGSMTSPYSTIDHALSFAAPGDTVYVRGGTYRLMELERAVDFTNSGVAGNPIVLRNYNAEEVVLLGSVRLTQWALFQGNIYRHAELEFDIKGMWHNSMRTIHPLYYDGGRKHPPVDSINSPGRWTLQAGYVYYWPFNNADLSATSDTIEASQMRGISANRDYLRIEGLKIFYTQSNGEGGGGVHITGDYVRVTKCVIGHNAKGNENAYAAYFSSCSHCTLSHSKIFDSHYWGGDGADQNSHVVALIDAGDSGPNIIEYNEIYNEGGLGVGTKGAVTNTIVRHNYIHGTAAGVKIGGRRSSGPGAGKTDRGHYRIYKNLFEGNGSAVRIKGDSIWDNWIYNNVFIDNGSAVAIYDGSQSIFNTQVVNNIFLNNTHAVYLQEKFYGDNSHYNEETFQYFKDRGLVSHHNLFWQNNTDWANPVNDWGNPTIISKTYEEIYSYKDFNWEERSIGVDPGLDSNYYPMQNSPVIDTGYDMGLAFNGSGPDIGMYEFGEPPKQETAVKLDDESVLKCFPNPFNYEITIVLPGHEKEAWVAIYDIRGQRVAGFYRPETGKIIWEPATLPNGIYLIRAVSRAHVLHKKVLFNK